jgi:hypothetical protein
MVGMVKTYYGHNMKQQIQQLCPQAHDSRCSAVVFSISCGVLGLVVLGISAMVYLAYEQSGASAVVSAYAVPELRHTIRYLSFGVLPVLALVLLAVPFSFRAYAQAISRCSSRKVDEAE